MDTWTRATLAQLLAKRAGVTLVGRTRPLVSREIRALLRTPTNPAP